MPGPLEQTQGEESTPKGMDLSPPHPTSRRGAIWLGREPTPTQCPPQTLTPEALQVAGRVDTPSTAQGGVCSPPAV